MLSIKGRFEDGVGCPETPVEGRNGQAIIITFLDKPDEDGLAPEESKDVPIDSEQEAAWDALEALIEECQIRTGIGDLAHQHDHYLYGTPKKS